MNRCILNKIVVCIAVIFLLLSVFNCRISEAKTDLDTMQKQAQSFIEAGKTEGKGIDFDNALGDIAAIGSILTTIGAGVMVGVVTYMGIKYLTAGPEAQAKLKTQLIGVVVSGMVIFGAYAIWKIVVNVAETF